MKAGIVRQAELKGEKIGHTVKLVTDWDKAVQCSQLVSLSYMGAGIVLVDSKDPEELTPADIENSDRLVDITEKVVYEIDEREKGSYKYPETPEDVMTFKQTIKSRQVLNDLTDVFKSIQIELPKDLGLVINLLLTIEHSKGELLDAELVRLFEKYGFLNLMEEYQQAHKKFSRENPTCAKEDINSGIINSTNFKSYLAHLDFGISVAENTLERQNLNYINAVMSYKHTGYETFRLFSDLSTQILQVVYFIRCDKLDTYNLILDQFTEELSKSDI